NWGGPGAFLQIGDGPANITVEHNTVVQTGSVVVAYGGSAQAPAQVAGFIFRNNMALHNEYGIKGDSRAIGNGTLTAYFPGAVVTRNVLAGGNASLYPDGNFFPSVSDFYAQFSNAQAGNFQLAASSSLLRSASDGSAIGVDPRTPAAVLASATGNVRFAVPRSSVTPTKPKIGG
ncbi:MAG: hypothetical protein ACM3NQ_16305, partial [Bacteroidales bacterium]